MNLTEEQRDAVRCEENLMLTACPGSGKTRVIISKLSRVIDEITNTPRSVACITYTNAAVQEIEARLRLHIQPGNDGYYDICTIHSFCLNHIFCPFCHLINGYKDGFKLLTPECTEFQKHVTATWAQHGRYNLTFRDFEEFTQLRMNPAGDAQIAAGSSLMTKVVAEYWRRIREAGFVDFANIIYYSFVLLRNRLEIASYISSKFAWLLVDEFQDTTDLQVEILALIADQQRTRFFLVGDPCQSIFRFAGARPDLAEQFASRIAARTDKQLSGNFRSSKPIVSHANKLYARTPPMVAVGRAARYVEQPALQHGATTFNVIADYFLPAISELEIPRGEAAILAPTWFSLFPLGRRLREYGVSVVGPGARPYRRNRQFAPLAEQVCGYLMEFKPDAVPAIERTLFNTLLDVTGRPRFDIFSYQGRVVVFKLLDCAQQLHHAHMSGIVWLQKAAVAFSEVLIDEGYLLSSDKGVFEMSVEEMKADMRHNKVDLANLTIDDLGVYASQDAAVKLATLHHAKGREFTAVAMIDLHEGRIPFYQASSAEEIEESKRLFYVGVTRAKRFLLYVTDDSDARNTATRFLRSATGVGVLN